MPNWDPATIAAIDQTRAFLAEHPDYHTLIDAYGLIDCFWDDCFRQNRELVELMRAIALPGLRSLIRDYIADRLNDCPAQWEPLRSLWDGIAAECGDPPWEDE